MEPFLKEDLNRITLDRQYCNSDFIRPEGGKLSMSLNDNIRGEIETINFMLLKKNWNKFLIKMHEIKRI